MKIFQLKVFLFVCFLALFGFISRNAAYAAITGKVGVGTWNTQAEFTDVKVVKGGTTLYQSDFATGMSDWATVGGTWGTANGNLQQTGGGTPALAFIGESTWSDYTLTLKARKISGDEGFLIALGSPGDATTSWWNIGGFGNTRHLLQLPGFSSADYNGSVQTGVWYDLKVELSGNNIRCYLNGALIHDATRMLNAAERTDRFNTLINSPGFALLNGIEQAGLRDLAGRDVWIGLAARATFDAMPSDAVYATLTPAQQALIIRKVNKNRMTWNRGWGFDGSNTWRDNYITDNMDQAVWRFNSLGVFDKHVTANNSPGTPTADGGYDGQMRFGSQMTVRCCIHEINHTLGVGTYWRWSQLMVNGVWQGQYGNGQLAEFDGPGAKLVGDDSHYFNGPYAMGYDQDYSWENARRSILLMGAMRRDMFLADQVNWNYDTSIANGTFSLIPRHASTKVLQVNGLAGANSDPLELHTPDGGANQEFQFDLQPEGTYRIRTKLPGNRVVELPGGNTNNGTPVKLWDDNSYGAQRWFMIPTDNGWYKIAPLFNNFRSLEIAGVSTADGAAAQSWDYLDGYNQQWRVVPTEQIRPTTTVPNGTYILTPRHAQDKVLEVYGFAGANGDAIDIWTANGGDNQKFLLDKQSDGTYRIRTALAGNRAVELPYGDTNNGNKVKLYDDNGSAGQRWYLIPTDNGWFKIAPLGDIGKSFEVAGISTANGALVQNWDYLSGNNQQWKLTRTEAVLDLSAPTYTVAESAGTATLTVTRTGNTSNAVSVAYATSDGTATQPGDYTQTAGTLNFAANETSKTITVPIIGDSSDEEDEALTLTLSNPQGGAVLGSTSAAVLTITDSTPAPTPGLSIADVSVTEGNSGTRNAEFKVTLSAASAQEVTVNYATADGTASASSDYTATSGTLTFPPGTTSKTITVLVTGDTIVEPNETFKVNLSSPVGATLTNAQATGTITNDDVVVPTVSTVTLAPTSPLTNGQIKATYTVTDGENYTLTPTYAWKKNDVLLGSEKGDTLNLSKAGNGDKNDSITVTVTVGDGTVSASKSATVKVGNSVPIISSVTLTPTSPTILSKLTATVAAEDDDKDELTYSYEWKKNGTVISGETGSSLDLSKPGNGTVGDSITVTAVANDGTASSNSLTSASVKVILIPNLSPRVVSVLPITESDKVGAKRTFAVRALDPNGAGDIESVWLLINDRLNWSEGATLIYVPSTASPAKGLLYLRQGDAFMTPAAVGTGTNTDAVLDNGCVSVTAKEVTVQVVGTVITVTIPMTVKEGLCGKNTLFARVQDQQRTVDAASKAGDQGFIRCGTYDVASQFVTPVKTAPTVGALTPSSLSTTLASKTSISAAQTVTVQVKDEEGVSDLDTVWFMASKVRNWNNSTTFVYVSRTRRLYLRSDNGQQWLGGGQIGSAGILENSQVRLDLSKVGAIVSTDGKGLSLTLPLQAKGGAVGANKVWLRVQDIQGATAPNGDDQGYVLGGTWNVTIATPKATLPSNGQS